MNKIDELILKSREIEMKRVRESTMIYRELIKKQLWTFSIPESSLELIK